MLCIVYRKAAQRRRLRPDSTLEEDRMSDHSTDSLYSTLPRSYRRGRSVQTHCTVYSTLPRSYRRGRSVQTHDSLYSTLPRSYRRWRSVQTHCTTPNPGPTGGAGQYRLTVCVQYVIRKRPPGSSLGAGQACRTSKHPLPKYCNMKKRSRRPTVQKPTQVCTANLPSS